MSSIIALTQTLKQTTGEGDGRSSGIRSTNGLERDLKASILYGKAKPKNMGCSPRRGSPRTGMVSTDTREDSSVLTETTVLSFGFYHFACILLLTYKPGPKFAIRNATGLSDTNVSAVDASIMLADSTSNKSSTMPV